MSLRKRNEYQSAPKVSPCYRCYITWLKDATWITIVIGFLFPLMFFLKRETSGNTCRSFLGTLIYPGISFSNPTNGFSTAMESINHMF
jgi:hypothetical protein